MRHDRALALACVAVVFAGCASVPVPAGGHPLGGDPHPGTPVVTQQAPETAVPTAEPRPNPWNDSTLTVGVDAAAAGDREIVVVGVPDDAVGWHVGNWLAYLLGAERVDQRPPPFRDASPDQRRGEWWNDD